MDEQEKALIERVLAGDSTAFEPLVAPYRGALLGLAARIVSDPEDAREVAQEALLKSFRYLRSFDPALSFRNWLFQIVVNTARGFRKRAGDDRRGLAAAAAEWRPRPAADDPAAGHEKAQARARLRECLDVLTGREREVFWLREIEELSVEQAARVLGSSSLSVRVHLNRARRKVRDRFSEKFRVPGGKES